MYVMTVVQDVRRAFCDQTFILMYASVYIAFGDGLR